MEDKIVIRPYEAKDKEAVLELIRLNIPRYFAPEEATDLAHYLDQEIEAYFVVISEGKLIGSGGINYTEDHKTGKISWDMLDPQFQGKGIGTRLLQYRIGILLNDSDIQCIMVRTSQLVHAFYAKNGFDLKEIIEDYWAPGFDLYRMEYTYSS